VMENKMSCYSCCEEKNSEVFYVPCYTDESEKPAPLCRDCAEGFIDQAWEGSCNDEDERITRATAAVAKKEGIQFDPLFEDGSGNIDEEKEALEVIEQFSPQGLQELLNELLPPVTAEAEK